MLLTAVEYPADGATAHVLYTSLKIFIGLSFPYPLSDHGTKVQVEHVSKG